MPPNIPQNALWTSKSRRSAIAEKKRHTRKSLCITGTKKEILYISALYAGSCHDYEILKDCFPAQHQWFKPLKVRLDLGFQGFASLYACKKVFIPIKKKRVKKGCSNELNERQKQLNKQQAIQRVGIEHSIGGMKRYRILSNRLRIKHTHFIDTIIGVCAGLWNFLLNQFSG
ncbi:MAG: transposase family protein [Bacteroidota bacterium]|nr:transposase family protein [Bacteroidota bacterium]